MQTSKVERKPLSLEQAVAALRQVYADHFARIEDDNRARREAQRRSGWKIERDPT